MNRSSILVYRSAMPTRLFHTSEVEHRYIGESPIKTLLYLFEDKELEYYSPFSSSALSTHRLELFHF